MTLSQILIFVAFAVLVSLLRHGPSRIRVEVRTETIRWLLLVGSLLAIYWMQPSMPIRNLDFWLPTATLALVVLVWSVTCEKEREKHEADERYETSGERTFRGLKTLKVWARKLTLKAGGEDGWTILILGVTVLLIGLLRYLPDPLCCLTPTRPPETWKVAVGIGLVGLLVVGVAKVSASRKVIPQLFTVLLIGLFIVLKTEPLAQWASSGLRSLSGQSTRLASALDVRWLGFSYIAFRLIHTLRDRLGGKLPSLSLREFVAYAIFFPAFTAGPIDRVQRFTQDFRQLVPPNIISGGQRVLIGAFKKFALADSLALIALNTTNTEQVSPGLWTWVLLYAYALRIYFDFSGYTDIAIGLGKLMGFNLPENFERPYLKPNLTTFWNSWHITLAQWFRAYFFNPLTRAMRSSRRKYPLWLVIFTGQISTMLLIGLWHGITWNYAAWGLWHGLGMFLHNRWSDVTRVRMASLAERPRLQRVLSITGTVLTFHYVALGWVWFALPSIRLSWKVMVKLAGG